MNDFRDIVENAVNAENLEDSETDSSVDRFTHWQRICAAGLAALSAGCTAWFQLNAVALVLNSNDVGISASEKSVMRRAMLKQLFQRDLSCNGLIRMSPNTFKLLCEKLQGTGRLRSYSYTSVDEQVATFLFILGQKFSNRAISFFMSRSGEICSRYFHNVLHALLSLAADLVKQPTENDISHVILQSNRFYPYFKDCLGAVDGTHVRVKVPRIEAARYRGRKDYPTQNVLACCTFDLRFSYILAGWEGSASDSRVLKSALTRDDPLIIPNGKYYLGDAGFGLSNKILVPYGRTRYHLKEYAVRGPENAKELFNLRHASLRNCIERCFGILKKRFPIISTGAEAQYSCDTMTDIILACCVLHNFLIANAPADVETSNAPEGIWAEDADAHREMQAEGPIPESVDISDAHVELQAEGPITESVDFSEDAGMDYTKGKELRDAIASEMWQDYEVACSLQHR